MTFGLKCVSSVMLQCEHGAGARASCTAHVPVVDPPCCERMLSWFAGRACARWLLRTQRGPNRHHDAGCQWDSLWT